MICFYMVYSSDCLVIKFGDIEITKPKFLYISSMVSSGEKHKHLIDSKDRDHITKPLPMIISKTSAYVKGQNEFTIFHEWLCVIGKNNCISNKVSNKIKKKFHGEPINNQQIFENQNDIHTDDKEVSKVGLNYACLATILLNSIEKEKMIAFITEAIDFFF